MMNMGVWALQSARAFHAGRFGEEDTGVIETCFLEDVSIPPPPGGSLLASTLELAKTVLTPFCLFFFLIWRELMKYQAKGPEAYVSESFSFRMYLSIMPASPLLVS